MDTVRIDPFTCKSELWGRCSLQQERCIFMMVLNLSTVFALPYIHTLKIWEKINYGAYRWLVKFGSGSKLWPIRIGCIDGKDLTPKFSVLTMQSLTCEDFYFICMETSYRGLIRKRQVSIKENFILQILLSSSYLTLLWKLSDKYNLIQQAILLCLREKAGTADVVMGLLQVTGSQWLNCTRNSSN